MPSSFSRKWSIHCTSSRWLFCTYREEQICDAEHGSSPLDCSLKLRRARRELKGTTKRVLLSSERARGVGAAWLKQQSNAPRHQKPAPFWLSADGIQIHPYRMPLQLIVYAARAVRGIVRVNVRELGTKPSCASRKGIAFLVDSFGSCRLVLFAVQRKVPLLTEGLLVRI